MHLNTAKKMVGANKMNFIMEELLEEAATLFRKAIESIHYSEFPVECQLRYSFPGGACGDTSLLLGKYLLEHYNIDCEYVCGSCLIEGKENSTHAWLEKSDFKIDITADQFDDINERVIVSKSHSLYVYYEFDESRKISEYFPLELVSSYQIIVRKIES